MKNGLFLRLVLAVLVIGLALLSIGGKGCNPWAKDDTTSGSSGVGPFDLIATAVSDSQIDLTWKHDLDPKQEPEGTGFELQRKTGVEGIYQTIATLELVTSYQDSGLDPDITYYYRARVYHTVGGSKVQYSNWSNEASATTQEEAVPWAGTIQFGTGEAEGVATDASGNIYVGGWTYGDLDGYINVGSPDFFLVKYNPAGEKQWLRQVGTTGEWIEDVATDTSGNIYAVGETHGDLGDVITNAGAPDVFVVKYDSTGVRQWTRQMGTDTMDDAYGVATDANGNIYVAGGTYGDLDGNTSAGEWDIYVTKYNPAGEKQWTRQSGTADNEYAMGVATDTSGNVYVVGDGGLADWDLFVIKYDTDGEEQWNRQLVSDMTEHTYGVATDTSGNTYVVGGTVGDLDGTNAGGWDLFVVKYNSAGVKQWSRQFGAVDDDCANGVTTDTNGNIYITGYTYSGLDGHTNAGQYDLFVVKYNSAGVKQWTRQLGTPGSDVANDVAADNSGNIYTVGYTSGELDGNVSTGGIDVFVVKYNSAGEKQ